MTVCQSACRYEEDDSIAARTARLALVAGLHVMLAAWALDTPFERPADVAPLRMDVRTVVLPAQQLRERPQPEVQPPKPRVQPPKPVPQAVARPVVPRAAPEILAAAPTAAPAVEHARSNFTVASQPPAQAKEEIPPASAPVTAARFDADYLQNPAPAYPPLSRKLREEGKALLLVQVSARGEAESVQIKQGSGFFRLDEAAVNAVRKWRFIPARRGTESVASSVVVPVVFRLDS